MEPLTIGKLTLGNFTNLVQVDEFPIADYPWTQVSNIPLTESEKLQIQFITERLIAEPAHLLNEATIWARAIYPLLSLAEQGSIHARAEVSLFGQYPKFQISGIADGVLGKTIGSRVVAPYLVIVEAKRGIEGEDPIPQLYGQILAAACLNWQATKTQPQIIYGCYTIADTWSFIRGEVNQFESDLPTLSTQYSQEYSQKYDATTILQLLKSIVAQNNHT